MLPTQSGYAAVNGAKLYYELAGVGQPLVMIHAGIADHRMWEKDFAYYAKRYQVLRFDMRGYGKSQPVDGEFNIQDDFTTLLDALDITPPLILMGCSIGAGLALDYALTFPDRVKALILLGGAPSGLELDTESPDELFEQAQQAFEANDLDLVTEIEMQIWFDGTGRTKQDVDPVARQLAYDMNRIAIGNEAQDIGKHIRKQFDEPAVDRLDTLTLPVLVIIGENDIPYLLAAAEYMQTHLPQATKATIPDAAHLPNMEHPDIFHKHVDLFLKSI